MNIKLDFKLTKNITNFQEIIYQVCVCLTKSFRNLGVRNFHLNRNGNFYEIYRNLNNHAHFVITPLVTNIVQ